MEYDYSKVTQRIADQIDKELLERYIGTRTGRHSGKTKYMASTPINGRLYDYMTFDELPTDELPNGDWSVQYDPKPKRTYTLSYYYKAPNTLRGETLDNIPWTKVTKTSTNLEELQTHTITKPGYVRDAGIYENYEGWEATEYIPRETKVKDPKLERTLQTAYTRAQLQRNRSEMKRLEQQMKRNRC